MEFGRDTGLALAGAGAPCVSEFAIVELAAALGMTTDAGSRYVGKVLEVRYRLPGFWEEVASGRLPWWRAARVAEHTMALPTAGARYVDRRLAKTAARVTFGQVERLTAEALALYSPEEAEEKRRAAADGRRFDIHTREAGQNGTAEVVGSLDLGDALDLETAISTGAAELKALGCEESVDVRRSMAAGALARRQTQLDLNPTNPDGQAGPLVKPRQTVIHVHTHDPDQARCETTRTPISVDQVAGWCTNPDTEVVIAPVIDLNEHVHVDRYERPDRMWDQAVERDMTCVFPFCTRPAASCDCDHVIPFATRWPDVQLQHRTRLPRPPPRQDPRRLDQPRPRSRPLPVAQPQRALVPPRTIRHPRPRPPHPRLTTPPHTPPPPAGPWACLLGLA